MFPTDFPAFLLGIQLLVILLLVIGLLVLFLRRQKKVIQALRGLLVEYREDLSGNSLTRHLQRELDTTTARCRQDTIALKPDLSPEDMAVSLRYSALQAELALLRAPRSDKPRWREQIKRYEELAQNIHEILQARTDQVRQTLEAAHSKTLAEKDQQIEQLQTGRHELQQQLEQFRTLQALFQETGEAGLPAAEMEQRLHHALLEVCDHAGAPAQLRELVLRLHEGYLASHIGSPVT